MPKYQVELQNGKKYVVEADSMPTEDEVATELQKNPEYMQSLSTPTDVFHKSAGENISGIAAGAGGRAKEIATGIVPGIVATVQHPVDAIGGMAKYAVTEPVRIGHQLGEGTPEAIGKSIVDTAMYIPTILAGGRIAGAGIREAAQTVPVRAVRSGAADVLRSASENSPELNAAASATGTRGKLGMSQKILGVVAKKIDPGPLRSVDRFMPNTSAELSTPPPNADVIPSQDAAVQAMVDRYMPNTSTGHAPAPMASHVQTPEALAAANAEANPNPIHDMRSSQDMLRPKAQATMQRMYDEAVRMNGGQPSTASAGTVRVPSGAEINPGELRPRTLEEAYALIGEQPPTPKPRTAKTPAPVAEAPKAPTQGQSKPRGLTSAATERLMKVHTPGWQDVSLDEPTPMPSHTPEPVKRPSEVSPIEKIAGTMKERYDQLAGMAIRTPTQELEFQALDKAMRASGASNKGYAYATQGKR